MRDYPPNCVAESNQQHAVTGALQVSDVISSGAMTNYRASEQEVVEMVMVVPALFEIFDHAERGLLIRERMLVSSITECCKPIIDACKPHN